MKSYLSIVVVLGAALVGGCKWPGSPPPPAPAPTPPPLTATSGTLTVVVAFARAAPGGPKWTYTVTDAATGAGAGFDRLSVDLAATCKPPVFLPPSPKTSPASPSAHWVFDYITLTKASTFSFSCDAVDGGDAAVESLVTSGNSVISRVGPVKVDGPK